MNEKDPAYRQARMAPTSWEGAVLDSNSPWLKSSLCESMDGGSWECRSSTDASLSERHADLERFEPSAVLDRDRNTPPQMLSVPRDRFRVSLQHFSLNK